MRWEMLFTTPVHKTKLRHDLAISNRDKLAQLLTNSEYDFTACSTTSNQPCHCPFFLWNKLHSFDVVSSLSKPRLWLPVVPCRTHLIDSISVFNHKHTSWNLWDGFVGSLHYLWIQLSYKVNWHRQPAKMNWKIWTLHISKNPISCISSCKLPIKQIP